MKSVSVELAATRVLSIEYPPHSTPV